jgi:hypothetical protein
MQAEQLGPPTSSIWRRVAPIVTLLLSSPVIGEVLFGATRLTTIFVLPAQIGAWGCASLIIRDLVRRRRTGWTAVLTLGIALAVAEECLIQQTSLAPLVGVDPKNPYGRALGVNWIYFLWAVGYESVWVVVLPIQLTELIFPARRDEPWLRTRGMVIAAIFFVLASVVAWYSWTQVFIPQYFPELAYRVPLPAVIIALVAIVACATAALGARASKRLEVGTCRPAPRPWLVGLLGFGLGLPWFGLIFLAYGAVPTLPFVIPMVAGVVLAGVAYFVIALWSRCSAWQDSSCLALVFGGLVASMLAGFLILQLGGALPVDVIGKLVLNFIAVLLLIRLAQSIRSRFRTP